MSIVIQKKKFAKNPNELFANKVVQHQRKPLIDPSYAKIFEDFIAAFQKSQNEVNMLGLKHTCEKFYRKLKSNDNLLNDLSKHGENLSNDSENLFLQKKALQITNMLSDHMMARENLSTALNNPSLWKSPEKIDKLASEYREITFRCLKILKLFTMVNPCYASSLSNKPGFSAKMLELTLQNPKIYFKQALTIIEALIAANTNAISPNTYPIIYEILSTLPKKYAARFSRIIALMVLEPADKIIFKELSYHFTENKITKIHSFLLSIPNFIEKYTLILEYLKQIMSSLMAANPENIQKVLTELKESKLLKDSGLSLNVLKSIVEQYQLSDTMANEIFTPKFITKVVIKKSNITEILFVLSNLLSSKRKIDVQNLLTQIGFFERVLNPLFDILFHPSLDLECRDGAPYSDDCYCSNPLTTTRIQLLRIIINFCDRDSPNIPNKDCFLSAEEKTVLNSSVFCPALKSHNSAYDGSNNYPSSKQKLVKDISDMKLETLSSSEPFFTEELMNKNVFANVQEKGLMHKVILLLNKVPSNSSYYFWLASCIESFLRGFHAPHQVFVAHSGMLQRLIKQIVTGEITRSNNVQISYDLLGEIIKFNKHNIIFLEHLCRKFGWTELLPTHALNNVVDSNVFFRSLWLSLQKFENDKNNHKNSSSESEVENLQQVSKICQIFEQDSTKWFNLLVEAVEPTLISQDNICCINTSLILALFADQKNNLHVYLDSLLQSKPKEKSNRTVLENYKNVLLIWHRYYMLKTKDSFSLQFTSALPFYSFQDMKQKLQDYLEQYLSLAEKSQN